jgi:two-component system, OmpR family, response regulator
MQLLLIEDDRNIALALRQALTTSHAIDIAPTGERGLQLSRNNEYDVIILDLHLPDMAGLEICEAIRQQNSTVPILVLTGEAQVMSKIRLLDAGANDYLTKPFSLGELKARLRVLERQGKYLGTAPVRQIQVGELLLDAAAHRVERNGQPIQLRKKEFTLLECLMRHAGSVVSRSSLAEYAWGDSDHPWANTIDVHIKYLRDKIDRPFSSALIKTVHGLGYKLEVEPSPQPETE